MAYNLKKPEEMKEYLENIGIEYRYGCFNEKNSKVCHLLGDFFESVKQDFEKAAKIYRTNCDDYNFPRSCFKYGNYRFQGLGGVQKDTKDAFKYYDKACTDGEIDACLNGGIMCTFSQDLGIPLNFEKGVEMLNTACDKGKGVSCHVIANFFIQGVPDHIKQDMKKAFQYSLKACEFGNLPACANLCVMYRKGDGVEKDLVKSEEYKKKCNELQGKNLTEIKFQQGT